MNKAQLEILKGEITTDPLTRGYSGMTDAQIADDLTTAYRERNLDRLDASTVFNAIDKAEYNALSDANKAMVWNILHLGEINPFGLESDIFVDIFIFTFFAYCMKHTPPNIICLCIIILIFDS